MISLIMKSLYSLLYRRYKCYNHAAKFTTLLLRTPFPRKLALFVELPDPQIDEEVDELVTVVFSASTGQAVAALAEHPPKNAIRHKTIISNSLFQKT